jgi:dipeptidyl aminopeptidase/acylaminoacyl peptidase
MQTTIKILASAVTFSLLSACVSSNNTEPSAARANFNTKTITQDREPFINSETLDTKASLTMEQIMSDPDWLGRQPSNPSWAVDGSIVYKRKQLGFPFLDTYVTEQDKGNGEKADLASLHLYEYSQRIDDEDSKFVAWIYEGNLFIKDKISGTVKQLTKSSEAISNIAFLNDTAVSFQRGNAFYSVDINNGVQEQVFSWEFKDAPIAVDKPRDYIEQEQIKLIQYIQLQRKNRAEREARKQSLASANSTIAAQPFYFSKDQQTLLASLSPDGKFAIVATREKGSSRDDSDIMPDYIEENGRIKAQPVRQRVADAKSQSHELWLVDISRGTKKSLSYVNLPGYNEDVLASVKAENAKAKGETYTPNRLPRDIGLLFDWYATEIPIKWHDEGKHVALMLEAWDNKDRWIVTVDTDKGQLETQHRMHDEAWVNYRFNQFGWFDNQQTLYLLSEESGYSQLYTKALNGELKAVTQGRFVVDDVVLSKNDEFFYYKANKKHPGIYEIYRTNIQTGETTALTDLNGMTDFELSHDEQTLLLTHSKLTMPPELYVKSIDSTNKAQKLTNTVSEAFLSIDWQAPAIVAVPSSHTEQPIYSRVYQPSDTATEKRRAVVFNHGAGYLQNAHLGWSGYFREFMFHNLLVSKGYVVLDMDFRASAGYGRDWRTAIYRQMGTPEVQDLVDGVNWLVENANVDRQRIGTYGGSYGGFLTFMALFNEPDLFQAGAALRPVSDWAHYNLPYTANILNHPDIDPIAYERSSPIYFAEGLTKPLLMNAPMVDDNVFFVDVVRLVQRLIELEKENFETAIYPVEPHGFVQPSSWLDEYRRIFKLFEQNL